jgi:hypothetical protein
VKENKINEPASSKHFKLFKQDNNLSADEKNTVAKSITDADKEDVAQAEAAKIGASFERMRSTAMSTCKSEESITLPGNYFSRIPICRKC